MALKPSLPKGTRDLLPEDMLRRNFIINSIRRVFTSYGFLPIETPAFENLSTLSGKYGEEGDRLIFRILNSGNFLDKADEKAWQSKDSSGFATSVSEKALRYDLTVPFARFVVQHQNELQFPFRRYQIQPVWRADRPQKGRYREFYQCDADVVGSDSLLLDLDFIAIYHQVFESLKLPVQIKINNRKILSALAEVLEISDRLTQFTIILDKLDKIGLSGVLAEYEKSGFSAKVGEAVEKMTQLNGSNLQKLDAMRSLLSSSESGKKGVEELQFIFENSPEHLPLSLDFTLARGLDYYTGSIFEVQVADLQLGSIGGGGRYDDLTGIFGKQGLSGIGISFGLDRIYLAMDELNLFPALVEEGTEILFLNFGEKEALYCRKLADELRSLGVKCETFPDALKVKKQMDYANKRNIPRVVIIGSQELAEEKIIVKDMAEGTQQELSRIELLEKYKPSNSDTHAYH